jgi:hypothetical protein
MPEETPNGIVILRTTTPAGHEYRVAHVPVPDPDLLRAHAMKSMHGEWIETVSDEWLRRWFGGASVFADGERTMPISEASAGITAEHLAWKFALLVSEKSLDFSCGIRSVRRESQFPSL